jgi:hypothetical protein
MSSCFCGDSGMLPACDMQCALPVLCCCSLCRGCCTVVQCRSTRTVEQSDQLMMRLSCDALLYGCCCTDAMTSAQCVCVCVCVSCAASDIHSWVCVCACGCFSLIVTLTCVVLCIAQQTLCYWRIVSSQLGRGVLPRATLLRGISMIAKAVRTFHLPAT